MASLLHVIFPDASAQYINTVLKRNGGDLHRAADDLMAVQGVLSGASPEPWQASAKRCKKRDPKVQQLMDLGFRRGCAEWALHSRGHNIEQALNLLLSGDASPDHMSVDMNRRMAGAAAAATGPPVRPSTHNAMRTRERKLTTAAQSPARSRGQSHFLHPTPLGPDSVPRQRALAIRPMGFRDGVAMGAHPRACAAHTQLPRRRLVKLLHEAALMRLVERGVGAVRQITQQIAEQTAEPPAIAVEDQEQLVALCDDMIRRFDVAKYRWKYGMQRHERELCAVEAGKPVPVYFANVQYNSIFYRKVLSMAGLRNLILHGRGIFAELKAQVPMSTPIPRLSRGRCMNPTPVLVVDVCVCNCPPLVSVWMGLHAAQRICTTENSGPCFQACLNTAGNYHSTQASECMLG